MVVCIWAKLSDFYVSIHTRYPANFIEITDRVPQIKQFKLYSSLFQVNMQLYTEYAWITNQIFHSFSSTVKMFNHECQTPIAHSVFKQTVLNASAQQLQQHRIEICCKMIQLPYPWTREANHSYRPQNDLLYQHYVGQLWHVSLIVF